MGQEQPGGLNCGIFERDNKTEVRGDQAMIIRKRLEQEKARFEPPSRDTEYKSAANQSPKKSLYRQPKPQPQLRTLQQIEHENVLKLSKDPFERSARCEFGFYEQSDVSLASLIESRYNTKLLFPEEEVLKLLESILYAAAFFERKSLKHHDLYPTNIFYVNGVFKVSHPKLTQSSYSLTIQRKRFSFLSPEQILDLRDEIEEPDEATLRKSDVFSLGMVMLEFCTLKPSCECYDQDNYDIIDDKIQERLQMIRQSYNPKVEEVVAVMLEYQMDKRIGIFDLAKHVNQYAVDFNVAKRIAMNQQSQMVLKGAQGDIGMAQGPNIQQGNLPSQSQLQVQPQQTHQNQPVPAQILVQLQQLQQQQLQQLMQPVVIGQKPPQGTHQTATQGQQGPSQGPPAQPGVMQGPSSTSAPQAPPLPPLQVSSAVQPQLNPTTPQQSSTVLSGKSGSQLNAPPTPVSAPKRPNSPRTEESTSAPRPAPSSTTNIQPPLSFTKNAGSYRTSYTPSSGLIDKDRPPSKVVENSSPKTASENFLSTYGNPTYSSYTRGSLGNAATSGSTSTGTANLTTHITTKSTDPLVTQTATFKMSDYKSPTDDPLSNLYFKKQYDFTSSLNKPESTSTKSSDLTSFARKMEEESLDERVRRILEKSKQIK